MRASIAARSVGRERSLAIEIVEEPASVAGPCPSLVSGNSSSTAVAITCAAECRTTFSAASSCSFSSCNSTSSSSGARQIHQPLRLRSRRGIDRRINRFLPGVLLATRTIRRARGCGGVRFVPRIVGVGAALCCRTDPRHHRRSRQPRRDAHRHIVRRRPRRNLPHRPIGQMHLDLLCLLFTGNRHNPFQHRASRMCRRVAAPTPAACLRRPLREAIAGSGCSAALARSAAAWPAGPGQSLDL